MRKEIMVMRKNMSWVLMMFLCHSCIPRLIGQVNEEYFGDRCVGHWEGTMYLCSEGKINDSLRVKFEVEKMMDGKSWKWKTTYSAKSDEITKDYILRLVDDRSGSYVIDEGDGIMLNSFSFGNRLYSTFSVGDQLLTANYQLDKEILFFEVTSGKKGQATGDGTIFNYSVEHIQKVAFRRT